MTASSVVQLCQRIPFNQLLKIIPHFQRIKSDGTDFVIAVHNAVSERRPQISFRNRFQETIDAVNIRYHTRREFQCNNNRNNNHNNGKYSKPYNNFCYFLIYQILLFSGKNHAYNLTAGIFKRDIISNVHVAVYCQIL